MEYTDLQKYIAAIKAIGGTKLQTLIVSHEKYKEIESMIIEHSNSIGNPTTEIEFGKTNQRSMRIGIDGHVLWIIKQEDIIKNTLEVSKNN